MTSKLQRLQSGDRLRGVSASTWNTFVDTAIKFQQNGGFGDAQADFHQTVLKVRNLTGADLPVRRAVSIGNVLVDKFDFQVYAANAPTSMLDVIGIALEPIRTQNVGHVAVAGVARAVVNVTNTLLRGVDYDGAAPNLVNHLAGRHRIVGTLPVAPGVQTVTLALNSSRQLTWRGVATENLAPGVGGNVLVYFQGGTLTVSAHYDWMHGDVQISVDKQVLVEYFPDENKWRVIAADCEDPPP